MNELMKILPTILEEKKAVEPGKEIVTCEAIGQETRANRLRLRAYAQLCAANNLEFIVSCRGDSYAVESPDITSFDGTRCRRTIICKLSEYLPALPTKVIDNILVFKDKIDMALLHIEHSYSSPDPALLYFLGKDDNRKYYDKLAEW